MKVKNFCDIDSGDWDDFVKASPDAWQFHLSEWIKIETKWFSDDAFCFGIEGEGNKLIAVCPLYLRRLGRGTWTETVLDSGHHRHAGPAFMPGLERGDRKSANKLMMSCILAKAGEHNADRVSLSSHNLSPSNWLSGSNEVPFWVREHGFTLGSRFGPSGDDAIPGFSTTALDQIVDLTQSESELKARLSKGHRSAVKKADSLGYEFLEKLSGSHPIDAFYKLAQQSATRTGETLQSIDYYKEISEAFGDKEFIFLLGGIGNRIDAVVTLLTGKDGCAFFSNVSNPEHMVNGVNNFLLFRSILWAKANGMKRFRMGPIFPSLPDDWPINKVSRFKRGFGAQSFGILQGSLFLHPSRYFENARAAVEEMCNDGCGVLG